MATSVSISGATFTFSALGQTAQYHATVLDQKGRAMQGAPVTWSSSAPAVLEVAASSGLATARGNGTAALRASSGAASGSRDVTVAQVPQAFSKVAGDAQTGTVGQELPLALSVSAQDAGGNPIVGAQVAFSVTKGGGTLSASSATTDAAGQAAVRWTLGTSTAESHEVSATIAALSALFTASPRAGPPATVSAESGNGQTGYAMEPLPDPLLVKVADPYGNPVAGGLVAWAVTQGGGSLAPQGGGTDGQGRAQAVWTLGITAGPNAVSATVAGLTPASFSSAALPNAVISGTVSVLGALLSPPQATDQEPARRSAPSVPRAARVVPDAVPGELIVVFHGGPLGAPVLGSAPYRSPAVAAGVADIMASTLASLAPAGRFQVAGVSPSALAARITVSEGEAEDVAAALRRDPRVRAVEPNYIAYGPPMPERATAVAPPSRTTSPEEFYPLQAWHYEMIGLPRAWELTTGSQAVTVAVVDDGIRFDHWDLTANLTNDGYDFVTDAPVPVCSGGSVSAAGDGDGPDPDPTIPIAYEYSPTLQCVSGTKRYGGHGTHVAGTIGAVGNNGGGSGVNWQVRIRPVRVLGTAGPGSNWDVAQGILYAAGLPASSGTGTVQAPYAAHVINLSLGGSAASVLLETAVAQAAGAGSLIVAAAGNESTSTPSYPAAYPEALAVSAVNPSWTLSTFSNFGSWIDIAAPGGAGAADWTRDVLSSAWDFQDGDPAWDSWHGTSMAAPHVSGVAALLFAANPGISAGEVRQRLTAHAYPLGPSMQYGAGLVDAFSSLTLGMRFPQDLYVRLVNAANGSVMSTVAADPDGAFRFGRLQDGNYALFAGTDERGDGVIGHPGRFWGARGGSASPAVVSVSGAGSYPASFSIGEPTEQEPNNGAGFADYLALDGYMNGSLASSVDEDWYVVQVPAAQTVTFSTSGWIGACGLAAQANTRIDLLDAGGALLAFHDDVDAASYLYCSELSMPLSPGVYYLRVRGSTSGGLRGLDQASGFYRVSARAVR